MSDGDGETEPTDEGPDWEAIGRRELARKIDRRAGGFSDAAYGVSRGVETGDIEAEAIREFRRELNSVLVAVEEETASIVAGVEPYGESRPYLQNYGMAADYLDLTMRQANEARGGATIELPESVVNELADGHAVEVMTAGGIGIELQPTQLAETNSGP